MPPQFSKKQPNWLECEVCGSILQERDTKHHLEDCPPLLATHNFIQNNVLYGSLDTKTNLDFKQIAVDDKDNLAFISQSAMQLCKFSMGQSVALQDADRKQPAYARTAWPTAEKTATSVLLTRNALELMFDKPQPVSVMVSAIRQIRDAQEIVLVQTGSSKNLDLTGEITNRLQGAHRDKLVALGNRIKITFYGRSLRFVVKQVRQAETNLLDNLECLELSDFGTIFYKVVERTRWILFGTEDDYQKTTRQPNLLAQIGGLHPQITELRKLTQAALGQKPCISEKLVCKGVLLYGAPGTGKTMLAHGIAQEAGCQVIQISASQVDPLKTVCDLVVKQQTIVVLDDIDLLCPAKRANDEKLSSVMRLFDLAVDKPVFIVATTSKLDAVDPLLRRTRRLDCEIEITIPNPQTRHEILTKILQDVSNDLTEIDLRNVKDSTHGFVGADLYSLVSRAALMASNRITGVDVKEALRRVSPSAMREVQVEVPDVRWQDVGGQDGLKLALKQAVEWPLKHPESFLRLGVTPPRGVLMFGPPGCSKTMVAKALATESGLNFISIKGPELFSKWVGESERAIRELFQKARQVAPSIVFFDEIDAIGGERSSSSSSTNVQERVLAQLLTELDGVTPLGDVTVLAATNRPDRIDKALLRPGRLDRIVYVPLPDACTRREIFNIKFRKMPVKEVNLQLLVNLTANYSGAEVNAVCHEAAMKALEESLEATVIEMRHFEAALKMITPRTPDFLLKIYEDYVKQ